MKKLLLFLLLPFFCFGATVELTWRDNSDNETGFIIEFAEAPYTSWTEVVTTAADATSYSHTTAADDIQLAYRIKATNSTGDSAYSKVRYFYTRTNQERNNPESRARTTTRRR